MLLLGAVLFLLGAVYMVWAVGRLQATTTAEESHAFDRPIAGLARLVGAAQERLDRTTPTTALERSLLTELRYQLDLNGRLLLFVLRLLIGSMVTTAGLMLLATTLAQRPLLGIFRRLRL